jgi:hypothetical protein
MSAGDLLEGEPGEKKTPGQPSRPTICAKCCHYGGSKGQDANLCLNPRFAILPQYDYVTGRVLNQTKPDCGDINRGDCPGFSRVDIMGVMAATGVGAVMLLLAIVGLINLINVTPPIQERQRSAEVRPAPAVAPKKL